MQISGRNIAIMRQSRFLVSLVVLGCVILFFVTTLYADGIKGEINNVRPSAHSFKISGVLVQVSPVCKMKTEEGKAITLDDLKDGMFVGTEGQFAGPGSLRATRIILFFEEGVDEIVGSISDISAARNRIMVNGITISLNGALLIGKDGKPISILNLSHWDPVRVRGSFSKPLHFLAKEVVKR